jgi:urease accessory protein
MALVGVFAVFHGHAHGAEILADASGLVYAQGFVAATALLHLVGIALGQAGSLYSRRIPQTGGVAVAAAGVALLTGVL